MRERISTWGIRFRIWLGAHLRTLLRPGSFAIGLIAVVYASCALLKNEAIPSSDAWNRHHPLGWLLVTSGVIALLGTFLVFAGYSRVLRKAEKNDELQEACQALWHLVVERLGIDMGKVGVHVWAVKGLKGFRYLDRRATFTIKNRRPTQVLWRKGIGAIGLAWDDDDPIIASVERLQERGSSERLFSEIPRRDRFGLGWRDFKRSKHYRSILAIPLRDGGKVRGCLSVDIQVDGQADEETVKTATAKGGGK